MELNNTILQYAEEEQVTEKVISMSLDLVHFKEAETCLLIDSLLLEENQENSNIENSSISEVFELLFKWILVFMINFRTPR